MPTSHANLSASGAHRWMVCPGSVKLEEGFTDTGSPYAKEGTLAHAVGELKLTKYFVKGIGPAKYKKAMDAFRKDPLWDEDLSLIHI